MWVSRGVNLSAVAVSWSNEAIYICLTFTGCLIIRFSTLSKCKSVHLSVHLSICRLQTQLMAHLEGLAYCPHYPHCLTLRNKIHIYKHFHAEIQLILSIVMQTLSIYSTILQFHFVHLFNYSTIPYPMLP